MGKRLFEEQIKELDNKLEHLEPYFILQKSISVEKWQEIRSLVKEMIIDE